MNVLPLLQCLADGDYHSGQDLGLRLGISRAAIWKQMQVVRELGVGIEAITGRGYCVPGGLNLLDKSEICRHLTGPAVSLVDRFNLHFSTGSTNTDAMAKVEQGFDRWLVMTEHQSRGRGRRGRQWVSPFGHNLYQSLLWTFQGGIAALEGLSLVCALVVLRTLKSQGYEDITLKWPNDVLFNGRKLAGILLEVSGDVAGPCRVVMGIGVNTAMPAGAGTAIDQPYSDLRSVSNGVVDRNQLAAALINEWVLTLEQFERAGFSQFRDEWMGSDAYLGQLVEIKSGANVIVGVSAGVDPAGRLLLDTDSGCITVAGGELLPSLRPVLA